MGVVGGFISGLSRFLCLDSIYGVGGRVGDGVGDVGGDFRVYFVYREREEFGRGYRFY